MSGGDTHGTLTIHAKRGSIDGPNVTITLLKWAGCVIINESNCMYKSVDDVVVLCRQLKRIVLTENKPLVIVCGNYLHLHSNYDGLDAATVRDFCIRYTGLYAIHASELTGIDKFQRMMLMRCRISKGLFSRCSQFLKYRENFFGSDVADMIVRRVLHGNMTA